MDYKEKDGHYWPINPSHEQRKSGPKCTCSLGLCDWDIRFVLGKGFRERTQMLTPEIAKGLKCHPVESMAWETMRQDYFCFRFALFVCSFYTSNERTGNSLERELWGRETSYKRPQLKGLLMSSGILSSFYAFILGCFKKQACNIFILKHFQK